VKLAAAALSALFVLVSNAASADAPRGLRLPGQLMALAAAGRLVAVGTVGDEACGIRIVSLTSGGKGVAVKPPEPCTEEDSETVLGSLWLGRSTIVVRTYDAPSPHGEDFGLYGGRLPRGPLRERGGWGWTDSDRPPSYGCVWTVASGGGVIAMSQEPNWLAYEHGVEQEAAACPAKAATRVVLLGATRRTLAIDGSWRVLATDGKRLVLAGLDSTAEPTGKLALVDLHGKRLAAPRFPRADVQRALGGWLAPEGFVLDTRRGITGPGWSVRGAYGGTMAEGRFFYRKGRFVHVRRIRGGPDRTLLTLRDQYAQIAAGAFGLAVATTSETATTLRRIPWRTIDATLPPPS
jgi:hypothetical protein